MSESPVEVNTVLVPVDGSDESVRAVEYGVSVAERYGADVHALYVVDAGEVESSPETLREEFQDALEAQGEEALESVRERTGGSVVTAVREGDPAAEIGEYAREHDADRVATGTRGRHGETRFLIGSVAERVVRTCPTPVLTVRQLDPSEA